MDLIQEDFISATENEEKMTPSQKKVLKAAIVLFADKGFNGTSTALIAEKANVSEGVIFKYFKTKQNLLNSILQIIIRQLVPTYSEGVIQKSSQQSFNFEEFIHFCIIDRYKFMIANANFLTIVLSEVLTDEKLVSTLKDTLENKVIKVVDLIEEIGSHRLIISGYEVIRLIISQLLVLFIEKTKLDNENKIDSSLRLDCIEKNIINASLKN